MVSLKTCPICAEPGTRDVYTGPIRAGRFGTLTPSEFRVLRCAGCGVDRLDPMPLDADAYESGSYRAAVDGHSDAAAYYATHDREIVERLALVGTASLRGKVIADVGCGAGALLDAVSGLAARTIGIEPQRNFGELLTAKCHAHYPYASILAAAAPASVDVALSFQVIEHVADPLQFLQEIATCLKPGGRIHLTTPNRNDILMVIGEESYRRFFYRLAHLWYFDAASLRETARRAGLATVEVSTPHHYDLSNFAVWLRDCRPSGLGALPELAGPADAAFRAHVSATGFGERLYGVFERLA